MVGMGEGGARLDFVSQVTADAEEVGGPASDAPHLVGGLLGSRRRDLNPRPLDRPGPCSEMCVPTPTCQGVFANLVGSRGPARAWSRRLAGYTTGYTQHPPRAVPPLDEKPGRRQTPLPVLRKLQRADEVSDRDRPSRGARGLGPGGLRLPTD
jgi:hypothetical protein